MFLGLFLGRILKKRIVIFKINSLEFVKVKKSHVKPNKFKFGTKIPIIWVHLG